MAHKEGLKWRSLHALFIEFGKLTVVTRLMTEAQA